MPGEQTLNQPMSRQTGNTICQIKSKVDVGATAMLVEDDVPKCMKWQWEVPACWVVCSVMDSAQKDVLKNTY